MYTNKKLAIGGVVLILIILGALIWYMANTPAPEAPTPQAGEPQGEMGVITENEQYWEIEATYPTSTPLKASAGAGADAHAVEVMKQFAEISVQSFKEESGLLSLSAEDIAMQGLGGDRKYALGMDYELHSSDSTVSYVYLIYADTLGAHPNAYYRTFTFDSETGTGLTLGDLFVPGSDYLAKLSSSSRAKLVTQIAEASNVSEAELSMDMIDAGTTPDEDNYLNFYLEGDALVIIFAPYQVGPWALGMQEVRLPKSELTAILKAKYQ